MPYCKGTKVKVGFLYSATYMVDQEQWALTISEVAVVVISWLEFNSVSNKTWVISHLSHSNNWASSV